MNVLDFKNDQIFAKYFSQNFEVISKEQKYVFFLGDLNINLLNYNKHNQLMTL